MISEKNIKPIPKYMLEKIQKLDHMGYPELNGHTRFYKYYTLFKHELCEVIVAVRHHRKKWFCKQVAVRGIHTDKVYCQDIGFAMGFYHVGWYREGISKYETWYDYDWGSCDDKYFNIFATIVNKEFISTLPEYKYAALDQYHKNNVLQYLRMYEKYPQAEYLVKAGLSGFATSKTILRECAKDKQFCKWLYNHRLEVVADYYYTGSIIRAYKQNRSINEVFAFDAFQKSLVQDGCFTEIKNTFVGAERQKVLEYLMEQKISRYSYRDYLQACNYLHLDMSLSKNSRPHDFQKWHDIRIDEYHSKKAIDDRKANRGFYRTFAKVAEKYLGLQYDKTDFVIVIAKSPAELVKEGDALHHCVGKMGYDQKFVREESLIFFVRNKDQVGIPFVTVEYSPKHRKVLQCYGNRDSKPAENVLNFVNKIWLPYANKKIKKVCA